jgi:putative methyltransferase (TIGR04325 family)
MNARDFVPPIAVAAARKLLGRKGKRQQYPSYAAALAECSDNAYENRDIVQVVLEKTKRLRAATLYPHVNATNAYLMVSLLQKAVSGSISVLDFGGACGYHYFLARGILPSKVTLRWTVVETPEMAKAANELTNDELSFSSDLSAAIARAERIDLLHTSGTLQCTDRPLGYLRTIVDSGAESILFNRLGLTKGGRNVVVIHESMLSWNGPGPLPENFEDRAVRYPFVFPPEAEFYSILNERYDLAMTFEDESGMFAVPGESIIGRGLLANKRINHAPGRAHFVRGVVG